MRRHNCRIGNACERCAAEDAEARQAEAIGDALDALAAGLGIALVAALCLLLAN
jgi:hypothetical protein